MWPFRPDPSLTPPPKRRRRLAGYLAAHWRGEHSVARSFLVNGLLVDAAILVATSVALVIGLVAIAFFDERILLAPPEVLTWLLVAQQMVVTPWQLVGLGRSAKRSFSAGRRLWPGLALSTAWGLTVYGVVATGLGIDDDLAALREYRDMLGWRAVFKPSRDGSELLVFGMIGHGFADAMTQALADHPRVRTINLASGGGFGHEAIKAAREVARRGLDTRAAGECNSACTMIFLAGRERILGGYGALGFHAPSSALKWSAEQQHMRAQAYEAELVTAGIAAAFARRAATTPHESIWHPTADELVTAGVVTKLDTEPAAAEIILRPP